MSDYRLWQDNGDYDQNGRSADRVLADVDSEMELCSSAVLVTRSDLTKQQTLIALGYIRWLIEMSDI